MALQLPGLRALRRDSGSTLRRVPDVLDAFKGAGRAEG